MAKTALITGATSGIGRAFAEQLAGENYDLILVARNTDRLKEVCDELQNKYSINADPLAADLSKAEDLSAVAARLEDDDQPVDMVINNAGFGAHKSFVEMTAAEHEEMVRVNINAVVRLSHAAMRGMVKRNKGDLINLGSVAAFTPGFRSSSTYAASKAFVIAFTEGLMPTIGGTNIRASVLCPGFVKTEFHKRAGITKGKLSPFLWLDADYVAREGLRDHRKGRLLSVPTFRYKVIVAFMRLVPRNLLLKQMNKMGKR